MDYKKDYDSAKLYISFTIKRLYLIKENLQRKREALEAVKNSFYDHADVDEMIIFVNEKIKSVDKLILKSRKISREMHALRLDRI